MELKVSLLLLCLATVAMAFGGSEDRLIKKYAMMKVYESCFGPEVVDEVKREMKEACLKCSGGMDSPMPPPPPPPPAQLHNKEPPKPAPPRPVAAPAAASEEDMEDQTEHQPSTIPPPPMPHQSHRSPTQLITPDRLQAILSLRPMAANPNRFPYPQQNVQQDQRPYLLSNLAQSLGNLVYDFGNNGYAPPSNQAPSSYWNRNPFYGAVGGGLSSGTPFIQSLSNLGGLFTPASAPVFPPSAYYPAYFQGGLRNSRHLDMRKHVELMASRLDGGRKIRNITCVMQELGYLNERLEPNYAAITERINRLPVAEELKTDMAEGVEFCRQFSMCLPETRRDKFHLTHEFTKPMSFFRCYKQKKLEACIMKDVRERYSLAKGIDSDEVEDGGSSSEEEEEHTLRRSMSPSSKKKRGGSRRGRLLSDDGTLENALFDFLYGPADGVDLLSDLPF